ncbi:hypothetical protein DCAR_0728041 [Daucus carota subsp. sativus]|uniref:Uncharacterized protein n=1 Tax=Daucus carota subsp. sativus TaxID=79200 RepID=A0A161X3W4_DAUCS|nr:PREDICTED: UPF0481 protein At3g47200-like [Daucus carota subsp. sativus]WOH08597.1 hypothetical protein DCAR_0728041 [Daucus carota subsp. sativus]
MDSTPIPNEGNQEVRIDVVERLKSSMTKELATLANDSYTVCIYRVSEKFRKSKEEAYTPRVVSIGPLHHGKSHLQAMEAYKLRYLENFISKFGIGIDKLVTYAYKREDQVRGCYEDASKFESEEFCKMILLDGIFVVQLFVKNLIHMRDPGDMLFENLWMASDLMHDMLLLENQLPLNFIVGLYEFMDGTRVQQKSFYDLSLDYFKTVGNTTKLKSTFDCERSRHLVEFLVILHRPTSNKQPLPLGTGKCEYTRSASKLHAAGVHFSVGTGELFEVSFDIKGGGLKLPRITVNEKTETFFRNLIAYEQCGHYEKYITSYVIFMDSLINTAEDVELLVSNKIIENLLGEDQQVADLFNNLHKEVIEEQRDFYFADICNELNAYSKDYIHEWKSSWFKWRLILKDDYFSNPWSFVAFMAASAVIVLTVIQTVCSLVGL